MFILNILKKIENFNTFFKDILFINNQEKEKIFKKTIQTLQENNLIKIIKNTIYLKKEIKNIELKNRSKSLLFNYSISYFSKNNKFKKAFLLSLLSYNKNRDIFFIEIISNLFYQEKYDQINIMFREYFMWLKNNNYYKSKELKLFFICINIAINLIKSNFINILYYSNYFFKYFPLNSLSFYTNKLSTPENYIIKEKNFVPLINKIVRKKYTVNGNFEYFFYLSLISINFMYFKFKFFNKLIKIISFYKHNLELNNYYFPYLYQEKYFLIINFGNIKELEYLAKESKFFNAKAVAIKFWYNHSYLILTNKKEELELLYFNFLIKYKDKDYNSRFKSNFLERYFVQNLIQKNYRKALTILIYIIFTLKYKDLNYFTYILLFLILLIKNNNFNFLNRPIINLLVELKRDRLNKIFNFPSKFKLTVNLKKELNSSNNNNNNNIIENSVFKNLTLKNLFLILIEKFNNACYTSKKKFLINQQTLIKNKEFIINFIIDSLNEKQNKIKEKNNELINTLKKTKKNKNVDDHINDYRKKDFIRMYLNTYNNISYNNIFSRLFYNIKDEKKVFSMETEITEINFFYSFFDSFYNYIKNLKNFNKKEKINNNNFTNSNNYKDKKESNLKEYFTQKSYQYSINSLKEIISDDSIFQTLQKENKKINIFITNYFKNYLNKLEKYRIEIVGNSESLNKKQNLTQDFLDIYDGNIENRFLRFYKAYVISKY